MTEAIGRYAHGSATAISSSGMFEPPTGNATYCLPAAMYVIGEPLALADSEVVV